MPKRSPLDSSGYMRPDPAMTEVFAQIPALEHEAIAKGPAQPPTVSAVKGFAVSLRESSGKDNTSRLHSHLPTPQSLKSFGQYIDMPHSPVSPLSGQDTSHLESLPTFVGLQSSHPSTGHTRLHPPSNSGSMITPDSSPISPREAPLPRIPVESQHVPLTPLAEANKISWASRLVDSPTLSLEPASRTSSDSLLVSQGDGDSASSPFIDKLSSPRPSQRTSSPLPSLHEHLRGDDVFLSGPMVPMSTPPLSHRLEDSESGYQLKKDNVMYSRHESDYFKCSLSRFHRGRPEGKTVKNEQILPVLEVVASPSKGRRLRLFHETSAESFEESLMAGGYGSRGTAHWLQREPFVFELSAPSTTISSSEFGQDPRQQQSDHIHRHSAFGESSCTVGSMKRLHPVDMEGKGRVLLDVLVEEHRLPKSPFFKKRSNRRDKRGARNGALVKGHLLATERSGYNRPNWPDSEFPWRLRLEEHAQIAKAEEADRLSRIERFLARASDDDDDEREVSVLAPTQDCESLRSVATSGRGKMVPLTIHSTDTVTSNLRHRGALFPTDSADARATLRSKKSVRSPPGHESARFPWEDDLCGIEEEAICICNSQDGGRELVQCDSCQTWFHLQCMGIESIAQLGKEEDPWYCHRCPPSIPRQSSRQASHEPAFAQDERTVKCSKDVPFFKIPSQLMSTWSPHIPTTPTRGSRPGEELTFASSWSGSRDGPFTPCPPHGTRMFSAAGQFDRSVDEDIPFDPTSTPSRGITLGGTPRNTAWSSRTGLFQTPSKQGRVTTAESLPAISSSSVIFSGCDVSQAYGYSPIRYSVPGGGLKPTQSQVSSQSSSTQISQLSSGNPSTLWIGHDE